MHRSENRKPACSCQFVNLAAYFLQPADCRERERERERKAFDARSISGGKAIRMEREIYLFPALGMYVCVSAVKQFGLGEEW